MAGPTPSSFAGIAHVDGQIQTCPKPSLAAPQFTISLEDSSRTIKSPTSLRLGVETSNVPQTPRDFDVIQNSRGTPRVECPTPASTLVTLAFRPPSCASCATPIHHVEVQKAGGGSITSSLDKTRIIRRLRRADVKNVSTLSPDYCLVPGVSKQEAAIRSMEPLASAQMVCVVDFEDEESVWVVGARDKSLFLSHLRIAGRQVHFRPENETVFRPHQSHRPYFQIYTIMRHLADPLLPFDPRFPIIPFDEILRLREALPFVSGICILQYGEVELLTCAAPESVISKDKWPLTIGELPYFVTQDSPARTLPSTTASKMLSGSHGSGVCLGVTIVGPNGVSSITAVTHTVVNHSLADSTILNLARKIMDAFLVVLWLLRQTVMFLHPPFRSPFQASSQSPLMTDLPITSASQWADKLEVSLLGIQVPSKRIDDCPPKRADTGEVTHVFDFPSAYRPYPIGYHHDLCLVTGIDLPEMVALPCLPSLTSFVPFDEAFNYRNKAIFAVTYPYRRGLNSETRSQLLTETTTGVTTHESLITGARFTWSLAEHEIHVGGMSSAILWRSTASLPVRRPENSSVNDVDSLSASQNGDHLSAEECSGLILCTGSDAASSASAVPASAQVLAFQNFQTFIPQHLRRGAHPSNSTADSSLITYKGGFRLPEYVCASEITMAGIGVPTSGKDVSVLKDEDTRR